MQIHRAFYPVNVSIAVKSRTLTVCKSRTSTKTDIRLYIFEPQIRKKVHIMQDSCKQPFLNHAYRSITPRTRNEDGCLVDCIKQPKRQLHDFTQNPKSKARTSILSQRYGPQSYYIIYGTGSIGASSSQSSRCRCGPVAMPLLPTVPICVPALTSSPAAVCASAKHA